MEKPKKKDYGFEIQAYLGDEPTGWRTKGGQESYEKALKKWEQENCLKTEVLHIEEGEELDIKRCYLDSSYEIECGNCGNKMRDEFNDNYLSYPKTGETVGRSVACSKCETEHSFDIVIKEISITVYAPKKVTS